MKTQFLSTSFFLLININYAFALENEEQASLVEEQTQAHVSAQPKLYSFDARSLFGGSNLDVDFIQFKSTNKNAIPVGEYSLNVSVNEQVLGELLLKFDHLDSNLYPVLCIDHHLLQRLDLKKHILNQLPNKACLTIKELDPNAYYDLDRPALALNLSLPLSILNHRPAGYIAPERFDKGVSSAYVGYQFSQSTYQYEDDDRVDQTYLSLNGGINLAGFNYRHAGYFESNNSNLTNYRSSLNTLSTDILPLRSRITVGDFNTQTYSMDSAPIRGIQIATDESMLPMSQRSYAPQIKGLANTNALVSVFQRGRKIFEKTVPAGNFEINDLTAVTADGDLTVQVTENGGEKHQFIVPLQGNMDLIRVGQFNYNFALGKYRFDRKISDDYLAQLGMEYGLSNYLSLYAGANFSDIFQSYHLGLGGNTRLGGIKFDAETSKLTYFNQDHQGQQYKLSYQYNFIPFKTSLNFNTLYQTHKYITLNNTFALMNYSMLNDAELENLFRTYKLKQQYNASITQSFKADKWGSLYLSSTYNTYWNGLEDYHQYNVGYSNRWGKVNYSLGLSQSTNNSSHNKDDTRYYLSLNIPLDVKDKRVSLYSTLQANDGHDQTRSAYTGISGVGGEHHQIAYALAVNHHWSETTQDQNTALTANMSYRLPQVQLEATTSWSDQRYQLGVNARGAVVAHPYGVTLANQISDTFAIIHAKGAAGAHVANSWGTKLDYFGNAIYSNLSSYNANSIRLDTNNLALDINLKSNQSEVIPRRYSTPLVKFDTEITSNIVLNLKFKNNQKIPIGVQAKDYQHNIIGMFGQSNQLFIEDLELLKKPIPCIGERTIADLVL